MTFLSKSSFRKAKLRATFKVMSKIYAFRQTFKAAVEAANECANVDEP